MIKHFINLTNGIEAIPNLQDWNVVRICSTTIEKEDWVHLLADLDHNLLFWLSQGAECHIYDYTPGDRDSKVITLGVPFIRAVLRRSWFGVCPMDLDDQIYCDLIDRADTQAKQRMKRKIKYYRKILNTDVIRLVGHSQPTTHDGDFAYYSGILKYSAYLKWSIHG